MRRRDQKRLQLELLESRVMLSAIDEAGGVSAETILDTAIHGNGLDIDLSLRSLDRMVIITGPGNGNVTIDLSQLPAGTRSLQISSFDSVTLTGELSVDNLVLKDIDFVDAGRISIGANLVDDGLFQDGLYSFGVEHIRIDLAPAVIVLQGPNANIGGKTLLEAGDFTEQGSIFSSLDSLGLSTTGTVQDLYVVSFNQRQTVLLNFQPANLHIGDNGFSPPSQISVVQGDFSRYFLASPVERSTLEQSHLVVRQAAITSPVSLSKVLNNPAAQAALASMIEGGPSLAHAHDRTLIEADNTRSMIGSDFSSAARTGETSAVTGSHAEVDLSLATPLTQVDSPGGHEITGLAKAGATEGDTVAIGADPRSTAERSGDTVSAAVVAALARLSEPFAQTVFDLRDGFTTYGDMASARLTDHLRTDRQLPLLGNTRTARPSDNREILVVMV